MKTKVIIRKLSETEDEFFERYTQEAVDLDYKRIERNSSKAIIYYNK